MNFTRLSLLFAMVLAVCTLSAQSSSPEVDLKFGKGLKVTAADSSMQLKLGFRMQSLYEAERDLSDDGNWTSSFMVRRARLKFDGWAVSPRLSYKVELALSNRDLKSSNDYKETSQAPKIILDAVLKYKLNDHLELWAGQAKLPGNRERVVSSQKLQFVDRSLVNGIFNIDRDMGLQLHGKFKAGDMVIKPIAAWSLGEGRNVTTDNIGGYSYTGRIELLPMGEFSGKGDYFEADLKRENEPKVAIGISYNYNEGASRQKQAGKFLYDDQGNFLTNDMETFFVDGIFKYKGFSMLGEYARKSFAHASLRADGFPPPQAISANGKSYYTGTGITLQASYLLKSNWEMATRFTKITPDHEYSFNELNEYTIGLSKYIRGHNLKVQGDVSLTDMTGAETDQLRYRLQFEFGF